MASVAKIEQTCLEQHQTAFRARMQAQCKKIEQYKDAVFESQGRRLSWDEAALEWIERYAEAFSACEAGR